MTARVGAWPRVQAPLAEHLPVRRPARQLPSLRQATSADGVGLIALLVRTGGVRLSRRDTDRGRLTVQAGWRSPRDLGPWLCWRRVRGEQHDGRAARPPPGGCRPASRMVGGASEPRERADQCAMSVEPGGQPEGMDVRGRGLRAGHRDPRAIGGPGHRPGP